MNKKTLENKNTLQDIFLDKLTKERVPVTIFLISGIKLGGVITGFDNFSVFLQRNDQQQLVYKHAISTILPVNPIKLFEQEQEGNL